jgi:hypothetical protein
MAENRLKRETQVRTSAERKKAWQRPELLPSPDEEPGYKYHWVRISTLGNVDATNVSSKLREGWEPVKAEDHPEMQMMAADAGDKFKDNIVIGGLLLCKTPQELVDERNEFYAGQAKSQMQAVDNNFMRENDPRMPLFHDRKSKVTFGNGN